MAPLYIAPPTPKKDHKGVGIKEYGPDEVHPSDAYHQNITNLLVRPKSAPITQYRAPSPSEDDLTSFNLTFNIMSNGIIDQLHAMAAGQNITVNAAAPYVAPLASTISTVTAGAATANETCDGTISVVSTDSAPARLETKPFAAKGTAVSSMSPTTTVLQFRTQSEYRSLLKRAQRLYGPDARVLIGNLPNAWSDDVLSGIVQAIFSEYGDCCACVFRGTGVKGVLRPYAIVQYMEHQDAAAAFYCGQDKKVLARPVRVELSRFA